MKAFIPAAGLGSRLKPWTLTHPKALVPVGDVPMLKRVADRLRSQGFDRLTVNVHHFPDQIKAYLATGVCGGDVAVSDESSELLETGGALLHARSYLCSDNDPFLVHNVDIISNADLKGLMEGHLASGASVTLLVSDRESSRKLLFDSDMQLQAWINRSSGEVRPEGKDIHAFRELAFSGIYIINPDVVAGMERLGFSGKFSIIDFMLANLDRLNIRGVEASGLILLDIGKPETLSRADEILRQIGQ